MTRVLEPPKCGCQGPHAWPGREGPCTGPAPYVLPDGTYRCGQCVFADDGHMLHPDILRFRFGPIREWDPLSALIILYELKEITKGKGAS